MTYTTLLFDLDNTLLSFDEAEKYALVQLCKQENIKWDELIFNDYHKKNKELWDGLEQGIYERDYVLSERFVYLFSLYGKRVDGSKIDQIFRKFLSEKIFFMPEAITCLTGLKNLGLHLSIVTNGVGETQRKRLKLAQLEDYFDYLFISEEIGYQKPRIEFFDKVLETIEESDKDRILLVGDSLSADILGGNQAGIDTCWYHEGPSMKDELIQPTYHISSLLTLFEIVKRTN